MTETGRKRGTHQILPEQKKPLSDAAIQARRAYYRAYNRKNADKRKQWSQNHWERVAAVQQTEERQED